MTTSTSSIAPRKLGDKLVFPIGYGAMGLSAFYGAPLPDAERFALLDAVHAAGCNYWDSADIYADSEDLLGRWFARTGKRHDIFLASKFGFVSDPQKGLVMDGRPERVKEAVESSLKRLGVEYIDLYYLHRPDRSVPIELTIRALAEFVKVGKIKHIGISECSAETLRRAHAVHPIAALQVEYSPFTLDIEASEIGVLAAARELGVTVVAYAPLGRGLLTGRYKSPDDFEPDDFRRSVPRYSKENFPLILALAEGLEAIGKRHGATGGQVALAWLLAQGDDIIPIPGTTKVKYLHENLDAVKLTLTPEEVAEVRALAAKSEGDLGKENRYPPGMAEMLFADTPPLKE